MRYKTTLVRCNRHIGLAEGYATGFLTDNPATDN